MAPVKAMNKGLAIFGIVVFVIGLFCVFWRERRDWFHEWQFPYREIGMILTVVGIVLTAIGLVFTRKSEGSS